MLAIIAIMVAAGVVFAVGPQIYETLEAWAKGCTNGQAFNKSEGRCFGH